MPSPKIDTSPANVARVLRSDADEFDALKMHGTAANRRALADAAQAAWQMCACGDSAQPVAVLISCAATDLP